MYFKESEEIPMNTPKTINDWCAFAEHTGKGSIYDYLYQGDMVSADMIDYFINLMPPKTLLDGYIQVGEPYNHVFDVDYQLKPTYMTFVKMDKQWIYCGNCFQYETIHRS